MQAPGSSQANNTINSILDATKAKYELCINPSATNVQVVITHIKNNTSDVDGIHGLKSAIQKGELRKIDEEFFGNTYLHWWIANDKTAEALQILQTLVAEGLSPHVPLDIQEKNGRTPLLLAIGKKYMDTASNHHVQYNRHDKDLIDFLIENSTKEILLMPDKDGNTPLHIAIAKRDIDSIKTLLKKASTFGSAFTEEMLEAKNKKNHSPEGLIKITYNVASKITSDIYKATPSIAPENEWNNQDNLLAIQRKLQKYKDISNQQKQNPNQNIISLDENINDDHNGVGEIFYNINSNKKDSDGLPLKPKWLTKDNWIAKELANNIPPIFGDNQEFDNYIATNANIEKKMWFSRQSIANNATNTVFVFGANAGHYGNRALGGGGQATQTYGNKNIHPINTMNEEGGLEKEYIRRSEQYLIEFVRNGGRVVFPVNKDGSTIGTGIAAVNNPVAAENGQRYVEDLQQKLQIIQPNQANPQQAMIDYNKKMDSLEIAYRMSKANYKGKDNWMNNKDLRRLGLRDALGPNINLNGTHIDINKFLLYDKKSDLRNDFQEIVNKHYAIKKDGSTEPIKDSNNNNLVDEKDRKRLKTSNLHGVRHIAHTNFLGERLLDLYEKHLDPKPNPPLNKFDKEMILVALAFHDSSRVDEALDTDELSSALLFLNYAIENELCETEQAIKLAFAMVNKDGDTAEGKKQHQKLHDILLGNLRNNNQQKTWKDYVPTKKLKKLNQIINDNNINKAIAVYQGNNNNLQGQCAQNVIQKDISTMVIHDADCIDIARVIGVKGFNFNKTRYRSEFRDPSILKKFDKLTKKFIDFTYREQHLGNGGKTFAECFKTCEWQFKKSKKKDNVVQDPDLDPPVEDSKIKIPKKLRTHGDMLTSEELMKLQGMIDGVEDGDKLLPMDLGKDNDRIDNAIVKGIEDAQDRLEILVVAVQSNNRDLIMEVLRDIIRSTNDDAELAANIIHGIQDNNCAGFNIIVDDIKLVQARRQLTSQDIAKILNYHLGETAKQSIIDILEQKDDSLYDVKARLQEKIELNNSVIFSAKAKEGGVFIVNPVQPNIGQNAGVKGWHWLVVETKKNTDPNSQNELQILDSLGHPDGYGYVDANINHGILTANDQFKNNTDQPEWTLKQTGNDCGLCAIVNSYFLKNPDKNTCIIRSPEDYYGTPWVMVFQMNNANTNDPNNRSQATGMHCWISYNRKVDDQGEEIVEDWKTIEMDDNILPPEASDLLRYTIMMDYDNPGLWPEDISEVESVVTLRKNNGGIINNQNGAGDDEIDVSHHPDEDLGEGAGNLSPDAKFEELKNTNGVKSWAKKRALYSKELLNPKNFQIGAYFKSLPKTATKGKVAQYLSIIAAPVTLALSGISGLIGGGFFNPIYIASRHDAWTGIPDYNTKSPDFDGNKSEIKRCTKAVLELLDTGCHSKKIEELKKAEPPIKIETQEALGNMVNLLAYKSSEHNLELAMRHSTDDGEKNKLIAYKNIMTKIMTEKKWTMGSNGDLKDFNTHSINGLVSTICGDNKNHPLMKLIDKINIAEQGSDQRVVKKLKDQFTHMVLHYSNSYSNSLATKYCINNQAVSISDMAKKAGFNLDLIIPRLKSMSIDPVVSQYINPDSLNLLKDYIKSDKRCQKAQRIAQHIHTSIDDKGAIDSIKGDLATKIQSYENRIKFLNTQIDGSKPEVQAIIDKVNHKKESIKQSKEKLDTINTKEDLQKWFIEYSEEIANQRYNYKANEKKPQLHGSESLEIKAKIYNDAQSYEEKENRKTIEENNRRSIIAEYRFIENKNFSNKEVKDYARAATDLANFIKLCKEELGKIPDDKDADNHAWLTLKDESDNKKTAKVNNETAREMIKSRIEVAETIHKFFEHGSQNTKNGTVDFKEMNAMIVKAAILAIKKLYTPKNENGEYFTISDSAKAIIAEIGGINNKIMEKAKKKIENYSDDGRTSASSHRSHSTHQHKHGYVDDRYRANFNKGIAELKRQYNEENILKDKIKNMHKSNKGRGSSVGGY